MTPLSVNDPMKLARTSIVYRPAGGVEGYREVHDKASALAVLAFPYAAMREVPKPAKPACYVFADDEKAYIGETSDADRRLLEHFRDPSKNFAREAYLVVGVGSEGRLRFNAVAAEYLQYHLTNLLEEAGLVQIVKGANPILPDVDEYERATLDTFVQQSLMLLFDAGCRVFNSNLRNRRGTGDIDTVGPAGPMEIDVIAAPPVGGELELAYGGLWARGYSNGRGFVVMAGAEIRAEVNPSAWDWVKNDRDKLRAAGALLPIPGLEDRERLCVAVQFDSASAAAKVVSGSRDGGRWLAPRHPQLLLTAA